MLAIELKGFFDERIFNCQDLERAIYTIKNIYI